MDGLCVKRRKVVVKINEIKIWIIGSLLSYFQIFLFWSLTLLGIVVSLSLFSWQRSKAIIAAQCALKYSSGI